MGTTWLFGINPEPYLPDLDIAATGQIVVIAVPMLQLFLPSSGWGAAVNSPLAT